MRAGQSFVRLLEVAFAGAATLEAALHVADDGAKRGDILFGQRDQAQIANDVDIGLGGVERDQFGALMHAGGGGVDARGLPPDFVQRGEAIEHQLADDDATLACVVAPFAIPGRDRHRVEARQFFRAGFRLKTDLWEQGALVLAELSLGGAPVGGGFRNTGVGLDGLLDGVGDREGVAVHHGALPHQGIISEGGTREQNNRWN